MNFKKGLILLGTVGILLGGYFGLYFKRRMIMEVQFSQFHGQRIAFYPSKTHYISLQRFFLPAEKLDRLLRPKYWKGNNHPR
jgi:hypothetical protein